VLSIGAGTDCVDYDAGLRRVYTANGIGSMTVIQQDSADQYGVKVRFRTVAATRS